ncbi:signal peptidase I [Candidatus Bathyarchaeota archaeon]|nr:signal peptidase I [Candidatus Bathyarchaeota archaeon]
MNINKKELVKNVLLIIIILASVQAGWQILKFSLNTSIPLAYVPSKSMEPTLKVGDLVVIKGFPSNEIKEGSIIVFYVPGHYGEDEYRIVHRVVKVVDLGSGLGFETKGDNNPISDYYRWGYIPASYIVGVVVYKIPYIGYAALVVRKPLGILIISILIAIILFSELFESKKKSFNQKVN